MITPDISVILPAYNEQDNLPTAIQNISNYLVKKFKTFELIIVNDGSKDNTLKAIPSQPWIRVISHPVNLGYGATLGDGFRAAKGKLIFYTDSDNQYDIRELNKLLPLIKKYDIVAGYRLHHSDPLMRVIVSWAYNLLIRILLGLNIKDVDCSFKLYKRQVFDSIVLNSQTGLIDAEILVKARKAGFSITQIGVNHYPRIHGKTIYEVGQRNQVFAFIHPRVPLQLMKEMLHLWPELH